MRNIVSKIWVSVKQAMIANGLRSRVVQRLEARVEGYVERALEFAHLCMIALLAACAKISYQTLHGAPFKFTMFLALLMVAIFAAFLAGSLIPDTFTYRDGAVGVAAWSGSEFVRAIEVRLLARIKDNKNG